MKTLLLIITAALGIASTSSLAADTIDPNMIGLTTENGRLARDFVDLWFNQHKPLEAFDKYVSRTNYMNHTTTTDVVQTFESEKRLEESMTTPTMHFEIKQIIAQGDLVVMHILATGGETKNGDELVEFLRFRDGKVVDHWDFHVPIIDKSAVFTGMNRQ